MSEFADLVARAKIKPEAAMDLAERRLLGIDCPADAKAALAEVQRAAEMSHADARRAWVYMTAAGLGVKADQKRARAMLGELAKEDRFAAVQLAFLDHLTCEKKLAEVTPKIISSDPYIALYPQLFSSAECRYLMLIGTPWLQRATVLSLTGEPRFDEVRDAQSCSVPHLAEDLVVQAINRCIAAATGTQASWGEPLNILRYDPGQQYHPHHDGTGSDNVSVRTHTALIWLNEDYEGGETLFMKTGAKLKGRIGDALLFRNALADGTRDPDAGHAGLPVMKGEKLVASRWIRARPFEMPIDGLAR